MGKGEDPIDSNVLNFFVKYCTGHRVKTADSFQRRFTEAKTHNTLLTVWPTGEEPRKSPELMTNPQGLTENEAVLQGPGEGPGRSPEQQGRAGHQGGHSTYEDSPAAESTALRKKEEGRG